MNYEDLAIFWWQILLQGPEVGDVNPLLIQPSSETLAGKNNSFLSFWSYINLQSSSISMTFSNKPSVQSTELQTWSVDFSRLQYDQLA